MQVTSVLRLMPKARTVGFILSTIGFLTPWFVHFEGLSEAGHVSLGIFLAAVFLWMFEAVPIYATSLLIILLQVVFLSGEGPLLKSDPAYFGAYQAPSYATFLAVLANPIIILFLGGFMLAEGAVKYDLDKTLTRVLLRPFGTKPAFILLGLMLVTGALSAFMSNTATTAMMMTVVLPIVAGLPPEDRLRTGLALAIPVAANVGGIATPIGTPPNAVVLASLAEAGFVVTFTEWVVMALPMAVGMLLLSWWLLLRLYPTQAPEVKLRFDRVRRADRNAYLLYAVFGVTVALWVTESWHGIPTGLVSVLPIATLTLTGILDKNDVRKLPWEVLWLVAGGLALGVSLNQTGLASWLVGLIDWGSFSSWGLLILFAATAMLLANFLSHTVTATLLVPLAVSLSTATAGAPNLLLSGLTIALATSLSMILPVSTPPNAIAISTGLVKTKDLAVLGSIIAVCGLLFILVFAVFYWNLFIS